MIEKSFLEKEYLIQKKSVSTIASQLKCSQGKVNYWLSKYDLEKRSLSDAQYIKQNPHGNPFSFQSPKNKEEWFLYGLGLGLYWGEGNKRSKTAVRLGNTDPDLVLKFLDFLKILYQIDESRLRFGLQIFSDIDPLVAKQFWCKKLSVSPSTFQKVIVTPSSKKGTYTHKSEYGVLTIYFSNTKIRDSIVNAIEKLRTNTLPM